MQKLPLTKTHHFDVKKLRGEPPYGLMLVVHRIPNRLLMLDKLLYTSIFYIKYAPIFVYMQQFPINRQQYSLICCEYAPIFTDLHRIYPVKQCCYITIHMYRFHSNNKI